VRVLQINSVCGIRSTGRICTGIAEVLEKEGHECRIAYGREDAPAEFNKYGIRISGRMAVRVSALSARLFDNAGFANKCSTRRFIKKAKAFAPDIIHLHNIHGYYSNLKIITDYAKKANIPVVLTLHDCWTFTGHCAHFELAGCDRWKTGCFDCPEKKTYPQSFLLDNSKKNYQKKKEAFGGLDLTVVGVSDWLSRLAGESILKSNDIVTIHNGIDLAKFKPAESDFKARYGLEGKKIILGVASEWNDAKGLADFVKLACILGDDYRLVLAGVTEKIKNQLPESIIAIERTDSIEGLCEIYTAADVFLNMTYNDSFPTVNLEALACGTPVVTYRTGGSPEAIDDTCGAVTAERSAESAFEAIKAVEGISAEACIARAAQFDMNRKFGEYLKLYEDILAKK